MPSKTSQNVANKRSLHPIDVFVRAWGKTARYYRNYFETVVLPYIAGLVWVGFSYGFGFGLSKEVGGVGYIGGLILFLIIPALLEYLNGAGAKFQRYIYELF